LPGLHHSGGDAPGLAFLAIVKKYIGQLLL
jgi:hypothetical protein